MCGFVYATVLVCRVIMGMLIDHVVYADRHHIIGTRDSTNIGSMNGVRNLRRSGAAATSSILRKRIVEVCILHVRENPPVKTLITASQLQVYVGGTMYLHRVVLGGSWVAIVHETDDVKTKEIEGSYEQNREECCNHMAHTCGQCNHQKPDIIAPILTHRRQQRTRRQLQRQRCQRPVPTIHNTTESDHGPTPALRQQPHALTTTCISHRIAYSYCRTHLLPHISFTTTCHIYHHVHG